MASNAIDVRSPLPKHEEIVSNSSLFWATLKKFHSDLGSKIQVPVLAGKEIDLHLLYVEITKKGGYDKVVSEKKWKEVCTIFKLPRIAAPYILKNHYFKTLYEYEQVYYFGLHNSIVQGDDNFPIETTLICTVEEKFDGGCLLSTIVGSEVYYTVVLCRQLDELHALAETTSTDVAPNTPTAIAPPRMIKRKREC